jgi:hypothetical protein
MKVEEVQTYGLASGQSLADLDGGCSRLAGAGAGCSRTVQCSQSTQCNSIQFSLSLCKYNPIQSNPIQRKGRTRPALHLFARRATEVRADTQARYGAGGSRELVKLATRNV